MPADPDRNRPLHRQRRQPGGGHGLVLAFGRHRPLGPQPAQQRNLLGHPPTAIGEVLTERLILHRVPAQADPEAEVAIGQQVDLGGLLGDQRRLALRQDDDAGDELKRDQRGKVAERDERLVESRVDVIRPGPRLVNGRVRAEHVVVGENVGEAELLHPLAVGAYSAAIGSDLGLRKDHPYIHDCLSTTAG